jgi:hypothetical protein
MIYTWSTMIYTWSMNDLHLLNLTCNQCVLSNDQYINNGSVSIYSEIYIPIYAW